MADSQPQDITPVTAPAGNLTPLSEAVLTVLTEALRSIRYGTDTVIIQDGRVIQIDRTERQRLNSSSE